MPSDDAPDLPRGAPVPGWTPRSRPPRAPLTGAHCRLEPLDPDRHAAGLWQAFAADTAGRGWTYLPYGPFADIGGLRAWLDGVAGSDDPLFHAILDGAGPAGVASYLRVTPEHGTIEVGHIHFGPRLQRTSAATEALYLMLKRAFEELGYRRMEWKCDALNAASCRAAVRLGFAFEGVFRQATIVKGRNRDTAWYSLLDREWPDAARAFEAWLAADNADAQGRRRRPLAAFRAGAEHPS